MNLNNILGKENSQILRGLAIMSIMLHNFLHNRSLGFTRENEMSYLSVKADAFFKVISSEGLSIYELFSYLGWVGVAVFVFLSGYGVMKSPPPQTVSETLYYPKSVVRPN